MLSEPAAAFWRVSGGGQIPKVPPETLLRRWPDPEGAPDRNLGYEWAHLPDLATLAAGFWGALA